MLQNTTSSNEKQSFSKKKGIVGLCDYVMLHCKSLVLSASIAREELSLKTTSENICSILNLLKRLPGTSFTILVDLCGVDYPHRETRYDVVYHLLSIESCMRMRVKISTKSQYSVPSINQIFPSALWYEREVYDLYGIMFSQHPDLRRILTDYQFTGHPMRKDFPLTGFVQKRYDDQRKAVINEPLDLEQDYRSFDFATSWEGMKTSFGNKIGKENS